MTPILIILLILYILWGAIAIALDIRAANLRDHGKLRSKFGLINRLVIGVFLLVGFSVAVYVLWIGP